MQSAQTLFAVIFCSFGALMVAIAYYQQANYDLRKIPMISTTAKHVIGLLLIIIAVLVFISQFIARR
jgi:threonine/homoserine/homoserine lactone efflux protein